ncbi:MAG: DNA mismatch repair endonuclease MutL [Ruminococcus sp.]|nr:DNA mismatch repair endonuclease MutL [Ruminococcus sp.]
MGVINVLDKHVAELIAAGEVVERPASAIKEMVENSIDAGATDITVEIQHGGIKFMRVTDNGCGIMRDDVKLAFLPHATSKIKLENDLDSIATLGFRGEALSSISSVSRLQLLTRNKSEDIGISYEIDGGEEISFEDAGCPVGTTIIVRDLFYNIPARMKFLKKDRAEGNAVANVIDKIALSHPEIKFTFIRDGKRALNTSGDGKIKSAIYSVYGRDFANGLIPVNYELNGIAIKGYITKPVNARPNRSMQNFFINGRYVKSLTAMAAIEEACKGSVMVGKFTACVLHMSIPFEAIDVNVHPSKIEVRFINERPVFDAVYHAVKTCLNNNDERKTVTFRNESTNNAFADIKKPKPFISSPAVFDKKEPEKKNDDPIKSLNDVINNTKPIGNLNVSVSNRSEPLDIYSKEAVKRQSNIERVIKESIDKKKPVDTTIVSEVKENKVNIPDEELIVSKPKEFKPEIKEPEPVVKEPKPLYETPKNKLTFIGEAFKTYILVEKNDKEIIIIDKHAAHERMIYEKLKEERGAGYSQALLQPITVVLNKNDYEAAISNLDMFKECAFDIEDFGNGTLIVRGAPQYLELDDIESSVIEMAGYIAQNKKDIRSEKMDWIYHNVACRAAIKGGNISTREELIDIANKLDNDPTLRYCPHGRPVCMVMSKYELEKQFGRV